MTATLQTLVSFNGANGRAPVAGLLRNPAGDLFGTTSGGGTSDLGTVFEIPKSGSGYGPVQTLADAASGVVVPLAGLIADAFGDLIGTDSKGGSLGRGQVFKLVKTGTGYDGGLLTIDDFSGTPPQGATPQAGVIIDAAGNLFGTTSSGGQTGGGVVFETNVSSNNGTDQTLVSLNAATGKTPLAGLLSDAAGDLFGTTSAGGSSGDGTVFEIPKISSGYGTLQTLVTFTGANGRLPVAGLISDAVGDLFGTTAGGGSSDAGTVFEIPKVGSGYGALQTLATFTGQPNGAFPNAGLIRDAAGDLFGTTFKGGSSNTGTVFEVPKVGSGYGALRTVVSFTGYNGASPVAGLIADNLGNLYGTTRDGGANNDGTAFEVSNARFLTSRPAVAHDFNGDGTSDMLWQFKSTGGVYDFTMSNGQVMASPLLTTLPSTSWTFLGSGDFNQDGNSDFLEQYNATGGIYEFTVSNGAFTSSPLLTTLPSSQWTFLGTGDFNNDGTSDFLMQYKATGGVYDFTVNNAAVAGSPLVATLPSSQWTFLGTGDFNGDGTTDFLEQYNTTGAVYDFTMSNGQVTASPLVTTLPSSQWTFLGTGDFNGDGTSDFLERYNATGGVYDFAMSNGQLTSSALVTTLPANVWTFLGTGDFNGDGTSDFLMQYNATGGVYDFGMSNGQVTSSPLVTTLPASSWSHLA